MMLLSGLGSLIRVLSRMNEHIMQRNAFEITSNK